MKKLTFATALATSLALQVGWGSNPTAILSSGGGSSSTSPYLVATTQFNNAQILALPSTPVEVVPAPGVGKYLFPIMAIIENNFTGGLTNVSDNSTLIGASDIVITLGANVVNMFRAIPIDYINGLGILKNVSICIPTQPTFPRVPDTDDTWGNTLGFTFNGGDRVENQNWMLSADNSGGNFTGGNAANTMTVTVYYTIRTYGSLTN